MHRKKSPYLLAASAASFCLLFMFLFYSCRKTDTSFGQDGEIQSDRFLALPATYPNELVRVAQRLGQLNKKANFLTPIARQAGYPVWDKVVYHRISREDGAKSTDYHTGDTLLYIPLVLENTRRVSAFILARLDGAIHLQLYQAKDYARYGFSSIGNSTHNADRLALQFMMLDRQVFGYAEFDLKDSRLFRDTTKRSTLNRSLQLKPENKAVTAIVNRTSGHWKEGTITHCIRRDNSGSGGENRTSSSGSEWKCTTTVHYYFIPGDDDGDGSSPGTGGGGGSGGGGGGTPPTGPQPCNATPELDNGLPPCPRGGDEGWIPRPPAPENDKTPCEVAQEWARKMDTLYAACKADSVVATIPNLANELKEKGFMIFRKVFVSANNTQDTITKGYFSGDVQTGTGTGISYDYNYGRFEIPVADLHTHPVAGYWAQSAFDVYDLIDHKRKDSRYMGAFVVSYNGNRYALTVTDPAAAAAFYNTKDTFLDSAKWKEGSTIQKAFEDARKYFRKKYKTNPNKEGLAYELALAAVLKQNKIGITLNKRDAAGHFKPVVINTVIPDISKPKKKEYVQDCL